MMTIGDYTILKNGKKRPVTKGLVPAYGGNGILDFVDKPNNEECVIVGRVGAYCGCVYYSPFPCWVSDNAIAVTAKDNADLKYIYYLLSNIDLHHYHIGGAQPLMTQDIISRIEVSLPPLPEQKRIAAILSSLDDKIENNRRINKNLEEQAQALFKSWFVDFEPFKEGEFVDSELGLIPKGWKVEKLGNVTSFISRGLSPKYNDDSEDLVLGQTCVRNNIVTLSNARRHLPKNSAKIVRLWDTLINSTGFGSLGRVGRVYFNLPNVSFDSHLTVVRTEDPLLIHYIGRNLLSRQAEIENMAIGSTGQTELPRDSVKHINILIPTDDILLHFNQAIEPMAKQMYATIEENLRLAQLRDTLLPKLMNGEIEI